MKKFFTITCAVMVLVGGCVSDKTAEPPQSQPVQSSPAAKNFYDNGQFKVGADIPFGEYVTVGTGYICISTTPEANAMNGEVLINENIQNARFCIAANTGEYVQVTGDIKLYPWVDAPAVDVSSEIPAGQYKVGRDLKAGEYKISLLTDGYFAVTRDGRRDYVKNQFAQNGGDFYATAIDGQYLQIKNGTGKFVGAVNNVNPAPKPAPSPKVLNLDMTLDQFKAAYKSRSVEISGMAFNIDNARIQSGSVQDVFRSDISSDVIVMGNIDKASGLIKETWVLSKLATQESATDALIVYGLIVATLNPELSTDQRGELMHELKILDEQRIKELALAPSKAIRGNVRYSITYMSSVGAFMLAASAKDL